MINKIISRVLRFLNNRSRAFLILWGMVFIVFVWYLDYITSPELSFLIFYLIPIVLLSWYAGRAPGFLISGLSAIAWVAADVLTMHEYTQAFAAFWNAIVKFSAFSAVSYFVSALRKSIDYEKELNRRLEHSVNELEFTNKELEAFNYSVSHDLRTPLIVIEGFARRLLKINPDKLDADCMEKIKIIDTNSQKMLSLVEKLLAFSRSGRQKINLSFIDMGELSGSVVESLTPVISAKTKININPLPPVYGDEILLRQVFYNLLSNAIKFSGRREDIIIEIGGRIEGDENVYYVKDNGVGFDMQQAGKLFDAFQRLHRSDEFEGTGLGLAIVQRIIDRHGGRIWAESSIDKGAVFYFALPNKS
jgi:signal transduction histidine kinase